jgi:hypothetical protein
LRKQTLEINRLSGYLLAMIRLRKPIALAAMAGALALAAAEPPAASAQAKPEQIGVFNDWEAYSFTEGKAKTCYALTRPRTSEPVGVKRGNVYLMVTYRTQTPTQPRTRDEVSVYFGYPLRSDAGIEASVGTDKFSFFGKDEAAWAPDARIDRAVVESMAKGITFTVKGVSTRGTATLDHYSLKGFSAALKAIGAACAN